MTLDFENLSGRDAYAWMSQAITPRPIAWVSTVSAEGKTNLAPFSYFQAVCSRPPLLMFSGTVDRNGRSKDSVLNVREVPEFVVNLVPNHLVEAMNATSATLPRGESEFDRFGVGAAPSVKVRPPRVARAPVSFECRVERIVDFGEGPQAANVVFGRIVHAHVDDEILGPDGQIDHAKLDTVGRLGGTQFTRTREVFGLVRPA